MIVLGLAGFWACAIGNFDANCNDEVTIGVVIVGIRCSFCTQCPFGGTARDKPMSVSSF